MSKPFSYWVRLALVATLSTLITFNPVLAGRWMDKFLNRSGCLPAPCCDVSSQSSTCAPVATCEAAPVVSNCPCEAPVASPCDTSNAAPVVSTPSITPMQSSPPASSVAPPAATTKTEPSQSQPIAPDVAPVTPAPSTQAPAPVVQTPAPATTAEVKPQPHVVEEPKSLPPTKIAEPTPALVDPVPSPFPDAAKNTAPVVEQPVQPKVDPVPETAPVEIPQTKPEVKSEVNDLFAPEPAKPATEVTEPAKTEPKADSSVNDLFGPPSDPVPSEIAPAKPAPVDPPAEKSESINDLFSDPKPAVPAAEPKAEVQKTNESDLEGLFGKPITIKVEDQSPAKTDEELDNAKFFENLFGKNEEAKSRARDSVDRGNGNRSNPEHETSAANSIFEAAPTAPSKEISITKEEPIVPNNVLPKEEPAPAPATIQEEKKPNTDIDLDKLFGVGSFNPNGSFNGAEFRQWVDNTGAYAIKARLSVIYVDKVKLLKENGRFTTVPLSRLSERDFAYVQWVASSLTGEQTSMMVKKENAPTSQEPTR